jgi:transposase InsO family protein
LCAATTQLDCATDRQDSQYASDACRQLLENYNFIVSMRRKGNCWDNSVVESFFGSLKRERVQWRRYQTHRGIPQGGVISPLISNVLLIPFDREMRRKGYRLTRCADDWVVTYRTRAEAQTVLTFATKVLGGCPRIAIVARARLVERDFSII